MAIFGLNPFSKKKGKNAKASKKAGMKALSKMKTGKKKAKGCEFC